MTTDQQLDLDLGVTQAAQPSTDDDLSAGRRLTLRQREAIEQGVHPLAVATHLPIMLRDDASRDLTTPLLGPRCGNCVHRIRAGHGGWPKCDAAPARITGGVGTDVRAWWPACRDYEVHP